MGATTKLLLPYPAATDPADGPAAFQALADRVELTLAPTHVTSLPSTPYDGQEVYYLADATNGVIWHLRYRAGASGSYKWEFVGGPDLSNEVQTDCTTSSTSFTTPNTGTHGPNLTIPLNGDYLVHWGSCGFHNTGGQLVFMAPTKGSAATGDVDAIRYSTAGANQEITGARLMLFAALTATQQVRCHYRVTGGTGTWRNRWLTMRPVRVG